MEALQALIFGIKIDQKTGSKKYLGVYKQVTQTE